MDLPKAQRERLGARRVLMQQVAQVRRRAMGRGDGQEQRGSSQPPEQDCLRLSELLTFWYFWMRCRNPIGSFSHLYLTSFPIINITLFLIDPIFLSVP